MQKIIIKINNDCLIFDFFDKDVDKKELNNTNIINTKEIIFTEEYIAQNIDLVSSFLNVVALKNEISKVAIRNIKLTRLVLRIINFLPNIKSLIISEKENISSDLADLIYESKYITNFECYNISNFMFEKLSKKMTVNIKSEVLFISDFMLLNNLNTPSDIYYKKNIKINTFEKCDYIDFEIFLKTNKKLKSIDILEYDNQTFKYIIELLIKYNQKNIKINITEKDENVSNSIEFLRQMQNLVKHKKIYFKIFYSEKYKEKYLLKQINLNIFKAIMIILILLTIGIFVIYKNFDVKEEIEIEKINSIKEETLEKEPEAKEEVKEDEYTKKYSHVLSELLKINNETVGWLKVNNTNIDYPVVKHSDNDYYLTHSFSQSVNQNGWLFADYRNTVTPFDFNTIIYGHNDGNTMFGSLKNVLNENWYKNKENQIISFDTDVTNKFQIFSIYTTEVTTDYLNVNYNENLLNKIKERSIYNFNINVSSEDKILTLSTCYKDSNYRLVVHAKKIA